MLKRIIIPLTIITGLLALVTAQEKPLVSQETAKQALAEGDAAREKAQYGEARSRYRTALETFERLGDKNGTAASLRKLGSLSRRLDRYPEALEYYQRLLALETESGNQWEVDRCLNTLGALHSNLGNYPEALEYYQRSLDLLAQLGDQSGVSMDLNSLGNIHGNLGNYPEALSYFQQALAIGEAIGDQRRVAAGLNNMGNVHVMLGQYRAALEYYQKSLTIREALGEKSGVAAALSNMGSVYNWLADYPQALEYYQQALRLVEALGDKREIARSLNNIGSVYDNMGRADQALEYYEKALKLREQIQSKLEIASSLNNLGSVHYARGRYAQAADYFQRALKVREAIGDKPGMASSRLSLGAVEYRRQEYAAADRHISTAIELSQRLGIPEILWAALHRKSLLLEMAGKTDEAVQAAREAADVIERVRSHVPLAEQKADFLNQRWEVYEHLIDLLVRSKKYAEAFHYAERSKARSFLELLSEAKGEPRRKISPDLLQKERSILAKMSRLQKNIWELSARKGTEESIRDLESELMKVYRAYDALKLEIRRRSPEYAALVYPEPITLAQAQKLLDERTALLEYVLGDKRSYVLAITHDGIAVTALARRPDLEKRIQAFSRTLVQAPSADSSLAYVDEGHKLYNALVKPVESALRGKHGLIIVPDGNLALLPFAALLSRPAAGTGEIRFQALPYLIKQYELSFAPSASVLDFLKRSPEPELDKRKDLVIFADPIYAEEKGNPTAAPRPAHKGDSRQDIYARVSHSYQSGRALSRIRYSGVEAEKIAALYGERATKYLRAEATEERVKAEPLSEYRYVHFAAHGIVNVQRPEFSAIVLGHGEKEDGFLQLPEVFNLGLDADLVVLSACESGAGKTLRGEGLLGLARGFMYAGARSVLASLWRIEDSPATVDWMYDFYRKLGDTEKAPALRRTQLDFIQGDRYSHPFYWAAFVLIGKR